MEAILDPEKKPPEERIPQPELWTVWTKFTEDDAVRQSARAKVQGAVDGNAPWSEDVLKKYGQSDRTNVNFLELSTVIEDWEGAYHDLALSVSKLYHLTPAINLGDEVLNARCLIEEELNRTLKGWIGWMTAHLTQANQLVTHGHGHFYFPTRSWVFKPLKVNQVFIPDNYDGLLDALPMCGLGPFPMTIMDLWALIATPDASKYSESQGWDKEVIKQTILEFANRDVYERDALTWEDAQSHLQRGNVSVQGDGRLNKGCQVCHLLVKEYNGMITRYIFAERTNVGKALCVQKEVADKITDLVSFFFLKGSKTAYHEVRGIGRDGYNAAVVLNRLTCRQVDEGEDAMTPTYKAGPGSSDGREMVRRKGRVNLVPSGWEPMPEKAHGSMQAGAQSANNIRNILAASTRAPSLIQTVMRSQTQPRTAAEIEASNNMGQDIRLTLSSLYYGYRDFLLKIIYTRILGEKLAEYEPGYAEQEELWGRLTERGLDASIWDAENWDINASRAIGSGSTQSRRAALEAIGQIYPRLDQQGQRKWDHEWAAVQVGYGLAQEFVPQANRDELPSADRSYAQLENAMLVSAQAQIEASPDQPPRIHLIVHFEAADQIAQGFKQNGDPRGYPALEAMLVHMAPHIDFMLQDQALMEEAEQFKERLASFVDLMKEMGQQMQAMQQAQQKQQQSEQQKQIEMAAARQSGASEAELASKLEKIHLDHQVKMRKADDAKEIHEKKAASAFELAMRKLNNDFIIAQKKASDERATAPRRD